MYGNLDTAELNYYFIPKWMMRIKQKDYINDLNSRRKKKILFFFKKKANKCQAVLIIFESCTSHQVFNQPPKISQRGQTANISNMQGSFQDSQTP